MANEVVLSRLRELVDEALMQAGQEPLDPDFDVDVFLPDVLDSVVLMGLLSLIEAEWRLKIDEASIDVDAFSDLRSIAGLVETELARSAPQDG